MFRVPAPDAPALDPHANPFFLTQTYASLVYSHVVRFPAGPEQKGPSDHRIVPDLAEKWEWANPTTVGDCGHPAAVPREELGDQVPDRAIVVDNENVRGAVHGDHCSASPGHSLLSPRAPSAVGVLAKQGRDRRTLASAVSGPKGNSR